MKQKQRSIGPAQIKAAQTALHNLRTPDDTISVRQLTLLAECSEESARKALKKLQERGVIGSRVVPGIGSPLIYFRRAF